MAAEPTIQDLFDLTDKTVLITGGTGYLGTAMSTALAEAGATVVISSRDASRGQAAADKLPSPGGGKHHGVELDHMDSDSIDAGFQAALDKAGGIDIVVNNGNFATSQDLWTAGEEDFNKTLANSTGYFLLARKLRDHAVEVGKGASVINLGSMYGQVASYPDAYAGVCPASPVAYHALKGGIIHMTRHLAVYWAKDNVRVNTLSPGPFPSEKASNDMVLRLERKSPMARMGKAWELKGAIVFLASEASSYMTGQNLTIDGGWTAW